MFELSYPRFPLEVGGWIADGEDTFGHMGMMGVEEMRKTEQLGFRRYNGGWWVC